MCISPCPSLRIGLFSKSPGSFQWRVILRSQDLGAGCAQCSWESLLLSCLSRQSWETGTQCILLIQIPPGESPTCSTLRSFYDLTNAQEFRDHSRTHTCIEWRGNGVTQHIGSQPRQNRPALPSCLSSHCERVSSPRSS